jgi:hypothetical protein
MRSQLVKIKVAAASALLALLLFPSIALASDDETAMGMYSYVGQGLRLHFILDLDGVRDLSINQRMFRGPIQLDEEGYAASTKTYTFTVTDKGVAKTVSLVVLFDSDHAEKGTVGFYYEHRQPTENMTRSVSFQPTFQRIFLDKLPSAKVSAAAKH